MLAVEGDLEGRRDFLFADLLQEAGGAFAMGRDLFIELGRVGLAPGAHETDRIGGGEVRVKLAPRTGVGELGEALRGGQTAVVATLGADLQIAA